MDEDSAGGGDLAKQLSSQTFFFHLCNEV